MDLLSSFSAPTKLVPLALKVQNDLPRLDVNLLSVAMNESAFKSGPLPDARLS